MNLEALHERVFETLINGDRAEARSLLSELGAHGSDAEDVLRDVFWPTHENLEKLHRSDQLTLLSYHTATRLLRQLVDQTAARLVMRPRNGKRVLASCGSGEGEELGAQMAVDILESYGYEVWFTGGGVPTDEILGRVHEDRPDILLMFSSAASDLPGIRHLIDHLHEIGACPNLQIVVGAGVFNRAPGLADELGADLCACSPLDLVDLLTRQSDRRAVLEDRTVGKRRPRSKAA